MHNITLTHYSCRPIILHTYVTPQKSGLKPHGLWLSDDTDYGWHDWCNDNHYKLHNLKTSTTFQLPLEKILHLKTIPQILKFNQQYEDLPNKLPGISTSYAIQWDKVAKKHAGILISPYLYHNLPDNIQHTLLWYYAWDCACACIWNTSILSKT